MVVLEAISHGIPMIVSAAEFCGISAELNDVENSLILNDQKSRNELRIATPRDLVDDLDRTGRMLSLPRVRVNRTTTFLHPALKCLTNCEDRSAA
jgi:hypothetical protein